MIKYNDPLENLIERLNKKSKISEQESCELQELLDKESPQRMGLVIMFDVMRGNVCAYQIKEWAKKNFPNLTTEEQEHVRMFLPQNYMKNFLEVH